MPLVTRIEAQLPEDNPTLEIPSHGVGGKFEPWPDIETILDRIQKHETGGGVKTGKAGEVGAFQIQPATAAMYGVSPEGLSHTEIGRAVAKRYLTDLAEHFHGDMRKAVAAYNAGPGRVAKGQIPESTHKYVDEILGVLGPSEAGAAETPPAKASKYSTLRTPDSYNTFEEYKSDWINTKQYLGLTSPARVKSFDALRKRWEGAQIEKKRSENAPTDFFGRLNKSAGEAIGGFVDRNDPTGVAGPLAQGVTQAVIPGSNIQAGIDAALFAVGGPELKFFKGAIEAIPELLRPASRLAIRLGFPTVGGAIGGATEGKTKTGAKTGLAQGALIEGVSGALGVGKRTIQNLDVRNIGEWLNPRIGSKIRDVPTLKDELVTGKAESRAIDSMNSVNWDTKRVLGNVQRTGRGGRQLIRPATLNVNIDPAVAQALNLPVSGSYPLEFDKTMEILDGVEKLGWDENFRLKHGHTAQAMRAAAHQMEEDITTSIERTNPQAASRWYKNREKLRTARAMSNLFREPNLIQGDNIDIPRLQKLSSDAGPTGYRMDIQQSVGKRSADEFDRLVHRGGGSGREDVQGRSPVEKMYAHLGFIPSARLQTPKLTRHVGYIPYNLGRGRALTAAYVLGVHEFAHRLENLFGEEDDAAIAATKEAR